MLPALTAVTATGTPLGAIQPTGGPTGTVVEGCLSAGRLVVVDPKSATVDDGVGVGDGGGRTTVLAQALTTMSATKTPDMSFIPPQLWHAYPASAVTADVGDGQ